MLEKTIKKLLEMESITVLFSDVDGAVCRQIDEGALKSPAAPLSAKYFLGQYDDELGSHSKIYFRYVDNVIRSLMTVGKQIFFFANTCDRHFTFTLQEPITLSWSFHDEDQ